MSAINNAITGYQQKLFISRLGLWLFFASDAFMFGGLLVSRFYLFGYKSFNLDQALGLLVTSILLISSFFMNRAEVLVTQGNKKGFITSLVITILLGVSFLVGVVGLEWGTAHFGPGDGAEGAVYYMMTGVHAFHVLTGIIFLGLVLRNGLKNKYTPEKHFAVEASANYWHFIDVIWIIFYPVLYLMGTL